MNARYVPDATVAAWLAAQPQAGLWNPVQGEEMLTTGSPAQAPAAPLQNNLSSGAPSPAVQDLQALLGYVLVRYNLTHGLPAATGLPASTLLPTDGWYGSETTQAVATFQQDFHVATATPGVYDAATQAALAQVLQQWQVGNTVVWDETPAAIGTKLALVTADHLGGVAPWRLGFESPGYWSVLASSLTPLARFPMP